MMWIVFYFFTWFQVKDHVQCLAIVRHLLIQACQVKLVLYVVFINLQHKFEEAKALLMALIKAPMWKHYIST